MEKNEVCTEEQGVQYNSGTMKAEENIGQMIDLFPSLNSDLTMDIKDKIQDNFSNEVVLEDIARRIERNNYEFNVMKKDAIPSSYNEEELNCSLFCGSILDTVKHHFKDCLFAHEEIEEVYYDGKTTISDKTVDILATLGATTTPNDLIKLVKGDRIYIRKILDDFDKVFNVIYQEKKKLIQ